MTQGVGSSSREDTESLALVLAGHWTHVLIPFLFNTLLLLNNSHFPRPPVSRAAPSLKLQKEQHHKKETG